MKDLISALEDLGVQIRNMQEHLRAQEWDSKEAGSAAIDVIIYAGMTTQAIERLRETLGPTEEPVLEPAEVKKEEERGEGVGEQIPGEEVHEEHPPEAPQEPEAEVSEGP